MPFATVEEAIEELRAGKMVIIVDDENRENEGDLVIAGELATPEGINFMAREGCGLICVAMTGKRLDELELPLMVNSDENSSRFGTGFTVSVEAKEGVTTGISAFDRAHTVRVLSDPNTTSADLARPGHIFPLRAKDGGVLERRGQTEASVDLAKLAGLAPVAVICEIMHEDGTMKRLPQLESYAERHQLKIVTVEAIALYRESADFKISRGASAKLPTEFGEFEITVYHDELSGKDHVALVAGNISKNPLVRLHSECLTGDAFTSLRCDCGPQLHEAQKIVMAESGVILYLRQEGRGIGLANKIKAYQLQDTMGYDTVEANHALGFEADLRHYGIAAQILQDLGVSEVRLLTNNPAKIRGLEKHRIRVIERVPLIIPPNRVNLGYFNAKRDKMDHFFEKSE